MTDAHRPLAAAWLTAGDARVARWVAELDVAEVWLDLEHGYIGRATLPGLVATVRAAGKRCRARVPRVDLALVEDLWALGVEGIIVPHVSDPSEATAAINAADLLDGTTPDWQQLSGRSEGSRPVVGVLIESAEGLKAADAIVSNPGLGLVIVGRQDLSRSLGVPPLSQAVQAANRSVFDLAMRYGVRTGIGVPRSGWPDAAWEDLARTADVVVVGHDYDFVAEGGTARIAALGLNRK